MERSMLQVGVWMHLKTNASSHCTLIPACELLAEQNRLKIFAHEAAVCAVWIRDCMCLCLPLVQPFLGKNVASHDCIWLNNNASE